jgi:hypothetical protein
MYSRDDDMGLVKTRRLAAMQKQQRAKAEIKPPATKQTRKIVGARSFGPPKRR